MGTSGRTYYRMDFEIVLLLGLTELQAQLLWTEKVRLPYLRNKHKFLIFVNLRVLNEGQNTFT